MQHFHAKDLTLIAVYTALLVAVQFALSFVAGVELISALLALFCLKFGAKRGMLVALCFSLLRCVLFGFFPTVIILYLIYYPLYALICATIGKIQKEKLLLVILIISVAALTVCFTLLDDIITPLISGFNASAWSAYFIASLPAMGVHTACAAVSTAALYYPLTRLFAKVNNTL